MSVIDFKALEEAPLAHDPFDHILVPGLINSDALQAANEDFPTIKRAGSFPTSQLSYGPGFTALLAALEGPEFASTMGEKLGMQLSMADILVCPF